MTAVPCTWCRCDDTYCEHGEPACDACEDAGFYMVFVLITVAKSAPEDIGAPWGSSWEVPSDANEAYALAGIDNDVDVDAELSAMGFVPEETW